MLWVVSFVLHRYANPAGAVKVTDPPAHKVVGPPAVMFGMLGSGVTFTTVAELAAEVQPDAIVRTV